MHKQGWWSALAIATLCQDFAYILALHMHTGLPASRAGKLQSKVA